MQPKWIALLAAAAALAAALAIGQDKAAPPTAEELQQQAMEAMAEMNRPRPEFQHAQRTVGTWDCDMSMSMGPGQPEMKSHATSEVRMLGRFWAIEDTTMEFMGQTMHGHSVTGYDIVKGKYICHWFDTAAPWGMYMEGELSADGNTMTYTATGPDMLAPGRTVTYTMVETWADNDSRTLVMSAPGPDGKQVVYWTLNARRRK